MFLQEGSNWFFSSSIWTMVITAMLISATNLYPHLAPTSSGFDQWDPCRRGGRGLPSRHMRGGSEIVMAVSTFLLQRAPEQWILHLPWEAGACSWVGFFGFFFPHKYSKLSFGLLRVSQLRRWEKFGLGGFCFFIPPDLSMLGFVICCFVLKIHSFFIMN